MLKVYCDFCGEEIKGIVNPDDACKVLKIFTRTIKGIALQIRFEVGVKKPHHICPQCARKAIKEVLQ